MPRRFVGFRLVVAIGISIELMMNTDGSRKFAELQVRGDGLRCRPFADEPRLPSDHFFDRPMFSKPANASPHEELHCVHTTREISNAARFLAEWFAGAPGFVLPCEIGGGVGGECRRVCPDVFDVPSHTAPRLRFWKFAHC